MTWHYWTDINCTLLLKKYKYEYILEKLIGFTIMYIFLLKEYTVRVK